MSDKDRKESLINQICNAMLRGDSIESLVLELKAELRDRRGSKMWTDISVDNFATALGVIDFVKPEYYSLLLQHINFTDYDKVSQIGTCLFDADRRASERGKKNIEQLLTKGDRSIFNLLWSLGEPTEESIPPYSGKEPTYTLKHLIAAVNSAAFDNDMVCEDHDGGFPINANIVDVFFSSELDQIEVLSLGELQDELFSAFCDYFVRDPDSALEFIEYWQSKSASLSHSEGIFNQQFVEEIYKHYLRNSNFDDIQYITNFDDPLILWLSTQIEERPELSALRIEIIKELTDPFCDDYSEQTGPFFLELAERGDIDCLLYILSEEWKSFVSIPDFALNPQLAAALEILLKNSGQTSNMSGLNSIRFLKAVVENDESTILDIIANKDVCISQEIKKSALDICIHNACYVTNNDPLNELKFQKTFTHIMDMGVVIPSDWADPVYQHYNPVNKRLFAFILGRICAQFREENNRDSSQILIDRLFRQYSPSPIICETLLSHGATDFLGAITASSHVLETCKLLLPYIQDYPSDKKYPAFTKMILDLVQYGNNEAKDFAVRLLSTETDFMIDAGADILMKLEIERKAGTTQCFVQNITERLPELWEVMEPYFEANRKSLNLPPPQPEHTPKASMLFGVSIEPHDMGVGPHFFEQVAKGNIKPEDFDYRLLKIFLVATKGQVSVEKTEALLKCFQEAAKRKYDHYVANEQVTKDICKYYPELIYCDPRNAFRAAAARGDYRKDETSVQNVVNVATNALKNGRLWLQNDAA